MKKIFVWIKNIIHENRNEIFKTTYSFLLITIIGSLVVFLIQNQIKLNQEKQRLYDEKRSVFIQNVFPMFIIIDERISHMKNIGDILANNTIDKDINKAFNEYKNAKDNWVKNYTSMKTYLNMYFGEKYAKCVGDPYIDEKVIFINKIDGQKKEYKTYTSVFFNMENIYNNTTFTNMDKGLKILDFIKQVKEMTVLFSSELRSMIDQKNNYDINFEVIKP